MNGSACLIFIGRVQPAGNPRPLGVAGNYYWLTGWSAQQALPEFRQWSRSFANQPSRAAGVEWELAAISGKVSEAAVTAR
jgi:hypothetical protein